ncbi:PREDICTED: carnitine O-palmitoyltransferase 1, liver isoform-like [Amphimedon queenslandica]|uniref:carnitine O-palmitoyltransferase n=1 Tax=Amphimedon queenslandica TaxID=400682 RepID=A0A1X7UF63_AMPQE|nr:PREDICTED: carnitine O-palmitoyltransferase 1, liver isoform-like [Amphimedon queenslandica]|eukprot:XP_003388199.1 PREDICTED: carnitine O-palmitoyltransferase 1, liver isoform-like [Amphimedon queenslandica]
MAEAHQAVAFQFSVSDDGVLFHVQLKPLALALWRLARSRCQGIRNTILKGIFPATPLSLLFVSAGVAALHATGTHPSIDTIYFGPRWYNSMPIWNVSICLIESLFFWTILCYIQRYTLKCLLLYKGWMFDSRGKRSLKTKLFALCVKLVAGTSNPLLGSYQRSLPRLPLPSIDDTCSRYLESVRPLYNDEDYEAKKKLVEDFKRGPAYKLNRYLFLKSWASTNYVTDWWEKYVYQGWRGSVMINSNYYACDHIGVLKNSNQIPRVACYIHAAMRMKEDIENEKLKPLIINDLIPLCSSQYTRLFGTCRIPGEKEDVLYHAAPEESRHIVIYRLGRWYKVNCYSRNKLLNPVDIQWQLEQIVNDTDVELIPGEKHLAALTSAERPFWASVRSEYFSSGVNSEYMTAIEKAAFFLNLDDTSPELTLGGENRSELLTDYCVKLLHGNGYLFWFDKSFSCISFKKGRIGINAEHSWADAPIIGHMLEYISHIEEEAHLYDEDGNCIGEHDQSTPKPQRMKWKISKECHDKIESAYKNAQLSVSDIDLYVNQHDAYGKGIIKRCGFSPDAFIQMALQLAYYRDSGGKFCLTYEASMTRLYREGRTETVRPCTIEAAQFVQAMCNPQSTKEECKRLLKAATDKHVLSYKNAMIGKGIDRHLFCLYVVSRGKDIPSPFLTSVINEPWKLSTSQTPTQQTGRMDYNNKPDLISCGGGFGPVTKDGYGVSYIIPGDYLFYFHVSSFKSSPHTDSRRFSGNIEQSLLDMIDLYDIVIKKEDGLQYPPNK